jgi:hypothetical protein
MTLRVGQNFTDVSEDYTAFVFWVKNFLLMDCFTLKMKSLKSVET